MHKISIYYL